MPPLGYVAYAMGLMLSPEALILLGNTLGRSGLSVFVGGLALALGLHSLTALMYGRWEGAAPVYSGEAQVLRAAWGPVVATVLPLGARLVFTVSAATGILAIAGYVFNEVFILWFPNLGFSFAILGVLVIVNLIHPQVATAAQKLAVALVLGGLLWLSGAALGGWGAQAAPALPVAEPTSGGIGRSFLVGLMLLMGCEMGVFAPSRATQRRQVSALYLVLALVGGGLLFGAWGWASRTAVAPTILVESTVPHMVAARAILGAPGRVLMGMVVLAGTVSAVNVLLGGGARMLAGMAQQALLPAWLGRGQARPALLLLALGPAAMMGLGMAGEPVTEVYTRAGILFWMLHYTAGHLAVLRRPPAGTTPSGVRPGVGRTSMAWLSVALLSSSIAGLLWYEPEPRPLLLCMGSVGVLLTCLSLLWGGYQRRWRRGGTRQVNTP